MTMVLATHEMGFARDPPGGLHARGRVLERAAALFAEPRRADPEVRRVADAV
jgi:ABC-type histidine transport system ATPase subunit